MSTYQQGNVTIEPVSGTLGAEISGIDLGDDLPEQSKALLRNAFLEHHVLFFRDQELSPEQQLRATRIFGEPDVYPFIQGLADTPEVIDIIKTEKDTINFGGSWHSDTSYMPEPALGTLLYAIEVPDSGGDTLFANTGAAYNALSEGMKQALDGVIGVYNSDHGYGGSRKNAMNALDGMANRYNDTSQSYISEHPIVRTHPESGLKGLYVGRGHTAHLKDMTVEESRGLIEFLADFTIKPEFTCRFRWRPGSVAVWDNRITQHYALNDYAGKRRHMRRVTMKGDKPF